MKKNILLIITLLIFGFTYASNNSERSPNTSDIEPTDSVSVNFYDLQKLKLYPNPASDYLKIEYDILFVKEAEIKIYNSIGSVVYSRKLENKQDNIRVEVSNFDNGLYFCSLQIDGKLLNTKKVLINHH